MIDQSHVEVLHPPLVAILIGSEPPVSNFHPLGTFGPRTLDDLLPYELRAPGYQRITIPKYEWKLVTAGIQLYERCLNFRLDIRSERLIFPKLEEPAYVWGMAICSTGSGGEIQFMQAFSCMVVDPKDTLEITIPHLTDTDPQPE